MRIALLAALTAALAACSQSGSTDADAQAEAEPAKRAPNFLIVVADDLGWSDLGAFGGEIRTPTLDGLAERGLMMTQYYVSPTCSPTRSMLMTGLSNHLAGVGTMAGLASENQKDSRNYAAQLHEDVVTLAEALKAGGYATLMSGKWHLAVDHDQTPDKRGFDRSFTLLPGGASHFGDRKPINPGEAPEYLEDGEPVELAADFYSSINYTDKLLAYLDEVDGDQPFLAYLAYTAPHDPLQVPDDWNDRYEGVYDVGPDAIKAARLARQQEKGLTPQDVALWEVPNFPPALPLHLKPWDERTDAQRDRSAGAMEIYAAMIELLDAQFARVLAKLDDMGALDDTYILFFSDNGASAVAPLVYPGNTVEWMAENWPTTFSEVGGRDAFSVMGREWANVSNTPWRLNKGQVAEGGTRSPMIVAGPGVAEGGVSSALGHVQDITPTLLELAGVEIDGNPLYDGKLTPQGVSLAPVWLGGADSPREGYGMELFGNGVVRRGDWKLSRINPPQGSGRWELFNLADDPGETRDLSETEPDLVESLLADYAAYETENGVIPPSNPPRIRLRQLHNEACDAACEQAFEAFQAAHQHNAPPQ